MMELVKLFIIIIIVASGIKILIGLPWTLCPRFFFAAVLHTPKRKINIYFILFCLFIQYIYLHFFSPQEIISALEFSFALGIPIGILGLVLYAWTLKQKREGRSFAPWVKVEDEAEPMLSKIEYTDYLNNCLGFSAIFLAIYIFFEDFFNVLVGLFY